MSHSLSCLTCHKAVARTRGCCSKCYGIHRRAVRDGETTWDALVAAGKVAVAKKSPWALSGYNQIERWIR